MTDKPLSVSINEAARLLSLSPRMIAVLLKRGELASVRIGRRRLITMEELERFADASGPEDPPPVTT
jgi:excisionase family DNA binding protein